MAGSLGSIVVSLILDTVSFHDGLGKAESSLSSTIESITGKLGPLGKILGTVGGAVTEAFSIAAMVSFGEQVVQTEEQIRNLATDVGSSVEEVSRLSNVAAVSGTSFDTFQMMLARVASGLRGAEDLTTKTGQALGYLKIQAKDPAEALQEVAQKLDAYADGIGKAALEHDLFGRSGVLMNSTLHDIAENTKTAASVTTDEANAAQLLAEQVRQLDVQYQTLKNTLLSGIVPALSEVIAKFNAAEAAHLGFLRSIGAAIMSAAQYSAREKELTDNIAQATQKLHDLQTARDRLRAGVGAGNANEYAGQIKLQNEYIAKQTELLKELRAVRMAQVVSSATATAGDPSTFDARDFLAQEKPQADYSSAKPKVDALTQSFKALVDEMNKQIDAGAAQLKFWTDSGTDIKATNVALIAYRETYGDLAGLDSTRKQTLLDIAAALDDVTKKTQAHTEQTQLDAAEIKAEADDLNTLGKAQDDWRASITKALTDTDSLTQQLNAQAKSVGGLSEAKQVDLQISALQHVVDTGTVEDKANAAAAIDRLRTAYANLDSTVAAAKAAQAAKEQWQQTADSIEHSLENAFDSWATGAKNVGQQLRDDLLHMFDTLVLKPLLQPIAGSVASLFSGGAQAANAGGGFFSNLSALGTTSGLTSLTTGGIFAGGGALQGFALGSTGQALGLSALAADGVGPAALTGLGTAVGAAIPVVGLALMALSLFGGDLFGGGHGPKTQGAFAGLFGSNGNLLSALNPDITGITGDNQDEGRAQQFGQSIANTYAQTLIALGGTSSGLQFGVGYSTDPNGNAPSFVHTIVRSASGGAIFTDDNDQVGRSDQSLQAELSLQAQRALLAALQASDVPKDIAGIIDSVNASSASSDAITQILTLAQALGTLDTVLQSDASGDAMTQFTAQAQGAYGAFALAGQAYGKMLSTFDGTTTATTALTDASKQYYASLVALLQQIQQVKSADADMFGQSIRGFHLSTLDTKGQYGFYQQESAADLAAIRTATDPATIQRLETQINADMNAAFGLLTPEQQRALVNQFIAGATNAENVGNARLSQIGNRAQTDFTTSLHDAQQAIKDAADKINDAATNMDTSTSNLAAQTSAPIHVDVSFTANVPGTAETNAG